MTRYMIFPLILTLLLSACDELFPEDDADDSSGYYSGSGGIYTITVISERYDTVEVKLDGRYMGKLVGYKSDLEFTAGGGRHTIEVWGEIIQFGRKEDALIYERDFFLGEDTVITIKPL